MRKNKRINFHIIICGGMYLYFLCVIVLASCVNAFGSNRSAEGYPVSFLTDDCPGSMKPTVISDKNKRFIEIYVYGFNGPADKPTMYTYNTIAQLANDSTMDWSRRTYTYTPGWMDNVHAFPMSKIMKMLYRRLGYNVWIVNVLKFMTEEWPIAVRAMMAVGDHVGEMLATLMELQPRFDPKKLEFTGTSLGGHTMGFIAKSFKKRTGMTISRLTSLDAAGPCFRNRGPEGRIDESDADFVDLILTNIDTYGMAAPVGHVNIYINGGEYQPGEGYWMICGPFCSHARAVVIQMFALVFHDSFIAIKCDSIQDARDRKCYDRKPMETITLGPKMDRNARGIYYLATTNFFPYFMGKNGLKKENDYVLKKLIKMNAKNVLKF